MRACACVRVFVNSFYFQLSDVTYILCACMPASKIRTKRFGASGSQIQIRAACSPLDSLESDARWCRKSWSQRVSVAFIEAWSNANALMNIDIWYHMVAAMPYQVCWRWVTRLSYGLLQQGAPGGAPHVVVAPHFRLLSPSLTWFWFGRDKRCLHWDPKYERPWNRWV